MKNNFLVLFTLLFVYNTNSVIAQVQNNGLLYMSDNASLYVSANSFTFGSGSTTTTTRTASTNGKLIFNAGVTISGAASGAALFADGFVNTRSSSYFVLPTGQTTTYAPIGVTNALVTNGVEAAYYIAAPSTVGSSLDATISVLPSTGYWVMKGDNVIITLIWSSNISSLTNSISELTVAGFNVSSNKWEAISSGTATGSLTTGTLSSSSVVNLSSYSAFTLAKKGISCAELVASSGNTCTWNGTSWSPSAPSLADAVVLSGDYPSSAGSFVCNSLAIGTNNVTLLDGQTIEVVNNISGTGIIYMSSESSILQRNNSSIFAPQLVLTKSTRTGMRANDYIYWGSPLTTDSYSQLANARAYDNANTVPSGVIGAFDSKYKYVSGDESSAGGWQNLTSISPGIGFITRIKNQAPFSSTANNTDHINLTFTGIANNGNVNVPISNIPTNPTSSRNYNLLSNPYPSAIDADKFLEFNTNLDGVVYIWKSQTPNSGSEAYSVSDYIAYTRAGSTVSSGIPTTFNGKIASGQGFKVKAITSTGSGTAFFNNCMRISGNNDQFMRTTSNNNPIDRYKLSLKGANGVGNQIVIAYMPETTIAYDRMYDAELNSVSAAQLYSTTQNDNRLLAINARPNFDLTDVVNLGVKKVNSNFENFSIAISDKEGVFASEDIIVYLYDALLNTYHNFANGIYSFNSNNIDLNTRFKVIYQSSALNINDFESTNVLAYVKDQKINISASLPISYVSIYDISGRLVLHFNVNEKLSISNDFAFDEGIYIAKIKLNNGAIATYKLLN